MQFSKSRRNKYRGKDTANKKQADSVESRERVIAYKSQWGNAYLSVRESVGNRNAYLTVVRNKDNTFSVINKPSKFGANLKGSLEMDKKGTVLTYTETISIQSDEERELFKSFLNGTLNANSLPEAPKRGRPAAGNGQTGTTPAPATETPAPTAPAPTPATGDRISRASVDQIKMASALVNAKQAKDLDAALVLIGVA